MPSDPTIPEKKDVPFIQVKNLHMQIGAQQILRGIDLCIRRGNSLVIVGGSGTGKSVFLKLVMGLMTSTSGSIIVDDQEITGLSERSLAPHRRKIGMLFQDGALFDSLSVAENVAFPLRERGADGEEEIAKLVASVLDSVNLLGHGHKLPSELSGGMRKRVALARAIVTHPQCVFYDEPTAGLDPVVADSIDHLIRRVQRLYKVTSVTVTHDMKSVRTVADRVVYFREGVIYFDGKPEEFFGSGDPVIRDFREGNSGEED